AFPYPNGTVGVHGYGAFEYDFEHDSLVPTDAADHMGYCWPGWISDYNYLKVLEFRREEAARQRSLAASAPEPGSSLLVSGSIDASGSATLRPLFTLETIASPPRPGPYTFELVTERGTTLLSMPFNANEIGDAATETLHFAFTIAIDESILSSVA